MPKYHPFDFSQKLSPIEKIIMICEIPTNQSKTPGNQKLEYEVWLLNNETNAVFQF